MARNKLIVPVVADSAGFKRGLKESEKYAQEFEAKIKGTTSHVRTHILGLGAAFLGVGGVVEGLKATIESATNLEQAHSQLVAQMKANGEQAKQFTSQLDALNGKMQAVGFTNVESEEAFARLSRAAGNSSVALKYMGLTADLAASKHVSLSQAALLVGKVIQGSTSALNRYGVIIPKGTSATEALAIAQGKLAGQAKAMAKPTTVFADIITNLEARIGKALLPTMEKYFGALETWIGKTANQKRLTDAVTTAAQGLTSAISTVVPWIERGWRAAQTFNEKMGGLHNTLVILGGAFLGYRATLITTSIAEVAFGAAGVGAMVAIKGALISTGIGVLLVGIGLAAGYVITHWSKVKTWFVDFIHYIEKLFGDFVSAVGGILAKIPSWLPGVGKFHDWGEQMKTWGATLGRDVGQKLGWAVGLNAAKAMQKAVADSIMHGTGVTLGPGGSPMSAIPGAQQSSVTKASSAQIAALAKQRGLDPRAVLGVASNEGLSGGIGDKGTSFGPFQLHVGGAFPSSMSGLTVAQKQAWAWSPAGISYALNQMLKAGAGGKKGKAAVDAIVHGFERPANAAGDLAAGYKAVGYTPTSTSTGPLPGDQAAADAAAKKAAAAAKKAAAAAYKSWKENYFTPLDNQYKSDLLITDEAKRLNKLEALHAKLAIDLKSAKGAEHQAILAEEQKVAGKIQSIRTREHNQAVALIAKEKAAYLAGLQAQQNALNAQMTKEQAGLARQETLFDRAFTRISTKLQDALTAKYAAATPEEQALSAFQSQLDAAQKAADMASAQGDLQSALLSGDPAAVAAAQAHIDDIQNQQKLTDLQAAATKSRSIQDAAGADALQNLNDWLSDQHDALEGGTESWDQFWQGAFSDAPAKYAPDAVSSLQGVIDQMTAIQTLQQQIDANAAAIAAGHGLPLPNVSTGLAGSYFSLNPVIPHFGSGGVMPGRLGQPGLAVLHGGETVTPVGGGSGGDVYLTSTIVLNDQVVGKSVQKWAAQDLLRGGAGVPGR